MALTKKIIIDSINILPDGQTQIREVTIIEEDGVEIAKTYHRHVIKPGDDLNLENSRVKTALIGIHTAQVISDFETAEAAKLAAIS